MSLNEIVYKLIHSYYFDERLLFSYMVKELVNLTPSITLFSSTGKIINDVNAITNSSGNKRVRPLFINKSIKTRQLIKRLNESIEFHKKNIKNTNNEIIMYLSALKLLSELDLTINYPKAFEEISNYLDAINTNTQLIGREREVGDIQRILQRSFKNNVVMVGSSGAGKTTIAKYLAKNIKDFDILLLNSSNVNVLDKILLRKKEKAAKEILIIIDEIFTYDPKIIKELLENVRIIATANDISYSKFISDNPHIISKFETVNIAEPQEDDLKAILNNESNILESKFNILTSEDVVTEVINLSNKYIKNIAQPLKGINLLEETFFYAKAQSLNKVTVDEVKHVISEKYKLPISSLSDIEKKDLSNLFNSIKARVKGQDEAIKKVTDTIVRSRLGFKKSNKPIGSFLFVGPSGVGKTELAKALSMELFNDESSIVRIDMSEFAEAHMVQRLIGAPPGYVGYEEGGQLTTPVKQRPYTVVLLDEIEKAHPRVFDIFLQVLDDGRLTDGQGKVVDFTNTIIIATSNAGIEDIIDLIEEGRTKAEIDEEIKDILQDYFRIEFLNRFDDIIIFNSLKKEDLILIAHNQITKLQSELNKKNIKISVSDSLIEELATIANDPRYGARGLNRLIQQRIENKLASMLISGELREGETVNL
jgi:ATP-dependent Clp protease ATP-binding subunit ClpC